MSFDAFSLESHLAYSHHFSVVEIGDLTEDELFDLHRDEHDAGFRGHSHDETEL